MDTDYENFVERMGSFEDSMDITNDKIMNNKIVTRNQSALTHHGILGMKWGHRKGVNSNTVGAAARTGKSATDLGKSISKGSFNKKMLKEAKRLSDDDLKRLTNRLNLENNYMNAKNQQQGRDRVENILSTSAAALTVVSSAAIMVDAIKKART